MAVPVAHSIAYAPPAPLYAQPVVYGQPVMPVFGQPIAYAVQPPPIVINRGPSSGAAMADGLMAGLAIGAGAALLGDAFGGGHHHHHHGHHHGHGHHGHHGRHF